MFATLKRLLQHGPLYRLYLLLCKHYRFWVQDKQYPRIYRRAAKQPLQENKVLFLECSRKTLSNSFRVIYRTLEDAYDFDLHCHFLRNTFVSRKQYRKNCKAMLRDIATAKYVFFDEATNVNGCIKMREETVVTQLWHGCGAFKKFGFSTADAIFGASREMMEKYPFNRNYTRVTVSSPEVIWAYEEAMQYSHESGVVKALGSSRTDIFYDQKVIDRAYENLYEIMPEARGKKVILYAPTFRGRVAKATTPHILEPEFMKYMLGDEYVLLFKHHPLVRKRPKIRPFCQDFAKDVTKTMTIEDLLCVADICISDYSSLVFEYSLFERPMLFLAHDLEKFFDWRGFYYDYYELAPGPIVQNTTGVIDYILHLDERFDRERVHAFRKKFMSACDGHATERIMDDAFGAEALAAHKRETPLPDEPYHLIPCSEDYRLKMERKAAAEAAAAEAAEDDDEDEEDEDEIDVTADDGEDDEDEEDTN